MHGDDEPYGSVHRVELFDKFPRRRHARRRRQRHEPRRHRGRALAGVAGRQPGAAQRAGAERARPAGRRPARRLGAPRRARASTPTTTASTTRPGPTIMDALWRPIAEAVMRPVFGDLLGDLDSVRGLGGLAGESYVDKDLRTLLGDHGARAVQPALLRQRARSTRCRASLWAAVDAGRRRARRASSGSPDPTTWRRPARRTGFTPGLIPNTFRDHQPPDVPAGARVPAPVALSRGHRRDCCGRAGWLKTDPGERRPRALPGPPPPGIPSGVGSARSGRRR